jgi:subtilisin family serine protease
MKRFTLIVALVLMVSMHGLAQNYGFNKIAPDLLEEINGSSKSSEMFQTIIVLNEQFDAMKTTWQMHNLNKAQQREMVIGELQQISSNGQKELLDELQQGQKATLVDGIQSFWIINAISCSMKKDMVFAIAERPDVKYIVKDAEIYIADGEVSENIQNERGENQWNVTKVNADDVWGMGYTGRGVVVAVIDTGVNYNHTDIANNMWDGGTDYPNHGWDFVNNDNDPMDDKSHGTHCAGIVSSYGTNGKQCGIAKEAKIMALKVLDENGHGHFSITIPAIEFAVSHGADILSMSLGGHYGGAYTYRMALENVMRCGVIAAVSAGNKGDNLSDYPIPINISSPANCPSPWRHPEQTLDGGRAAVVAVGSTTSDDTHSSFSSYGPSTWAEGANIGFYDDYPFSNGDPTQIGLIKPDISAPGSDVVSLKYSSNDGYITMSGTSMAAPCVAGVMALMLQVNPTLTPVEIDSIIETTAVQIEGQTSKNNTFGAGRIDAMAAINYMLNACAIPTNLTATANEAVVALSWDTAENVTSYRVYRNGIMIAKSVSDNSYTDTNAPAGSNTYFVRSNGENYQASLPSNQVTVNITTNPLINTPSDFSASDISTGSSTATLNWNAPVKRNETLCYVDSGTYYCGIGMTFIAAQKFPSSMLQPYAGMQIEHIFFSLLNADATCTIELYEGDGMLPETKVFEDDFTTTEAEQNIDYLLSNPVAINPNKDLWLIITTTDSILSNNEYAGELGNAFLYKYTSDTESCAHWLSYPGLAFTFQLGLSDKDYTYNVYRNNIAISSNQSGTSYTDSYTNGMNEYRVTASTNGYESSASNAIMIVNASASLANLSVNSNDKLTILPNSTLTVTGTLSNDNAANLVLENGAQLIHNSANVQATVKKSIAKYTSDQNGWNFIASPVTESITPSADNGLLTNTYDLYMFDQSQDKEWRNIRAGSFETIDHKTGYLYANSGNLTLTFAGTLAATTEPTVLAYDANASLKGFNLIGNPYPCNTTIANDFYLIIDNEVTLAENGTTIAPCESVVVKATGIGESIIFTKPGAAKGSNSKDCFDLVIKQDNAILDRARIRFGEGTNIEKFTLDQNNTQISLWQNGKDFAVAYANGQNEMPINFKAIQNGTYTLNIETSGVELDYFHLIDNMTGMDVDLLATPSYTFNAKTTDYESRFKLVFASEIENGDSESFVFFNNGNIIVNGMGTLQVMDVLGRQCYAKELSTANCQLSTANFPAGVYVLRLVAVDGVKTQKLVID